MQFPTWCHTVLAGTSIHRTITTFRAQGSQREGARRCAQCVTGNACTSARLTLVLVNLKVVVNVIVVVVNVVKLDTDASKLPKVVLIGTRSHSWAETPATSTNSPP